MRSENSMFPDDMTGLAIWCLAGMIFGFLFSGCAHDVSERETLRAHRADVVLSFAENAVGDAQALPSLVSDAEASERLEAARASALPAIRAARDSIRAYLDAAEEGWQGALACAAAAITDLLDVLRAAGVSGGFPMWLGDALSVIDSGAGYVSGGCQE